MGMIDKKDWERIKLSDIAFVSAGQSAPKNINDFGNTGIPFIRAGHLSTLIEGVSELSLPLVSDEVSKKYKLKLYKKGSVVFAKSGMSAALNRIYTLKQHAYIVSHIAIVEPKEEKLNNQFLNYFFCNYKPSSLIKDEAYPSISLTDIQNIIILLPPLPTQHQIVKELDCLSTLLEKQKQQLAELDTLAQAIFYDMFGDPVTNEKGWEKKKLGEVCSFASGLVNPLELPYSDMLHVGGDNIESGTGILKNLKFAKELGLKSGKFLFSPEDILYNKIRPNLNKVALPDFVGICSADMYPIQPKARVTNKYFLYFILKSEGFLAYAETQSRRANIPKMNVQQMSAYIHILPPLPLQQQFASKIEAIELQKEKVQASIKDTQQLFDYTMDKYFN